MDGEYTTSIHPRDDLTFILDRIIKDYGRPLPKVVSYVSSEDKLLIEKTAHAVFNGEIASKNACTELTKKIGISRQAIYNRVVRILDRLQEKQRLVDIMEQHRTRI